MTKYEIMFIVKPTLEEKEIKEVAENMKKALKQNKAKIIDFQDMGQKDLAYEIDKHQKGYYYLLVIEAPHNAINEFDRLAVVSEDVIRHLIIKKED